MSELTSFSSHEYRLALALVHPPEDLDNAVALLEATLRESDSCPPAVKSLSPDLLYLLSLVSPSCAERAFRLTGVDRKEFDSQRQQFAKVLSVDPFDF